MRRSTDTLGGTALAGPKFLARQWRRMMAFVGCIILGCTVLTSSALAQAPPPAAPVVTISRSWYFEALIVAAMIGLALFVVCRSSRRN